MNDMQKIIEILEEKQIKYDLFDSKLIVHGHLDLSGLNITNLPQNLKVTGSLILRNTPIPKLPDGLSCGLDLDLRASKIKSLSDNLFVGGNLYLNDTAINQLPNNLIVGWNLDLTNTQILEIPSDIIVGRDLILKNSSIKQLPNGFKIGQNLYLNNSKISTLPENLVIGGDLDLTDTLVENLPKNLLVGKNILFKNDIITNPNNESYLFFIDPYKTLTWKNGKYLAIHGCLYEVLSKHKKVLKLKYLTIDKDVFIFEKDDIFAFGNSLLESYINWLFITAAQTNNTKYKNLDLNNKYDLVDLILWYKNSIGVTVAEIEQFIKSNKAKLKSQLTLSELYSLTKGICPLKDKRFNDILNRLKNEQEE